METKEPTDEGTEAGNKLLGSNLKFQKSYELLSR